MTTTHACVVKSNSVKRPKGLKPRGALTLQDVRKLKGVPDGITDGRR